MGVNSTEIRIGKYIIKGAGLCLWIDEEYIPKKKDGTDGKKTTKRVAGYVSNYEELYADFVDTKFRSAEAQTVKELLKQIAETEKDLKLLVSKSGKVARK